VVVTATVVAIEAVAVAVIVWRMDCTMGRLWCRYYQEYWKIVYMYPRYVYRTSLLRQPVERNCVVSGKQHISQQEKTDYKKFHGGTQCKQKDS
jgi:hypothetical protein